MVKRIRNIDVEDAEALLDYFRALVVADPERVETVEQAQSMTVEKERLWIEENKVKADRDDMAMVCLEVRENGKLFIVAVGEVECLPRPIEQHMGEIRLGILPDFAKYGEEIVNHLCREALCLGIESLLYCHLETQDVGINIMTSCGFEQVGYIPHYYRRQRDYVGRVILQKIL